MDSESDQQRIELIGPVDASGGDGPSNGMHAIQRALRRRINKGLDWLAIKSLPASRDAIPWFWNWADQRYAAWWDEQGFPFVPGPNILFVNSRTPRIDGEECALLDAANRQAMFCHTHWYRDLIGKYRGPTNQSEIILWTYPIDPLSVRAIAAEQFNTKRIVSDVILALKVACAAANIETKDPL